MRSSQLSLEQYDSDKTTSGYLERYDPILEPWLAKKIVLLELGVRKGGSLLLWRDYFPLANIVGIDIRLPTDFKPSERIHVYEGSQADPDFLSRVASETAPGGFDIIIDDASHVGELTRTAFWHLFDNYLKPGGLYAIEDWGTGYWNEWRDGKGLDLESYDRSQLRTNTFLSRMARKLRIKVPMKSHNYGMVGFIKQLIDEQGANDVTRRQARGKPQRRSKFKSILIEPGIVFVTKADCQIQTK